MNTLKERLQKTVDNINKETKRDNAKLCILLLAAVATAVLSILEVPILITSAIFVIIPIVSLKITTRIREYRLFKEKLISLINGLEQNNKEKF